MEETSYRPLWPDILLATIGTVAGSMVVYYLHSQWFGPWMAELGDPPMSNGAYPFFSHFFQLLPFVIGGPVTGIIAGFGAATVKRIMIRLLCGPMLSAIILAGFSGEVARVTTTFLSLALAGFILSQVLSAIYLKVVFSCNSRQT